MYVVSTRIQHDLGPNVHYNAQIKRRSRYEFVISAGLPLGGPGDLELGEPLLKEGDEEDEVGNQKFVVGTDDGGVTVITTSSTTKTDALVQDQQQHRQEQQYQQVVGDHEERGVVQVLDEDSRHPLSPTSVCCPFVFGHFL